MSTQGQTGPTRYQVAMPVADILDAPEGRRTRQLLYGEPVEVQGEHSGWLKIQAYRDGYRGVMHPDDLGPLLAPTHQVIALATHLYTEPDMKSRDVVSLSFGTKLSLTGNQERGFFRTHEGLFVPAAHVAAAHLRFGDPVAVAELFLGTPYLWGGNSRLGLDCSGLVQVACLACGVACPGDSGAQEQVLGQALPESVGLQRGDLIFWKGHVAWVVNESRMLHANAHHMSVAFEPIVEGMRRILDQGDGPVTSRRRLDLKS